MIKKILLLHVYFFFIYIPFQSSFADVDGCEIHCKKAMSVNGHSVGFLSAAAAEVDAKLVQISTDYVFDGGGKRPYRADDPVSPLGIYGQSKEPQT